MRSARVPLVVAALLSVSFGLLTRGVVSATVLLPMPDADLVDTSSFVVTGEVTNVHAVVASGGGIETRVRVAVDEGIKGHVGRIVTFVQPGGEVDGRAVVIFGNAQYTVGERVLVFLRRRADGALTTNALGLGKYRIEGDERSGRRAVREAGSADRRALEQFVRDLRALAGAGPQERYIAPADEETGASVTGPVTGRFTFLGPQLPARWFEPDGGRPVALRVVNSDNALGRADSERVLNEALGAWTEVPTASIVLAGAVGADRARSVAGGVCDGQSQIQFNDPFGEIPALRGCRGVLAVGGFCTATESIRLGGATFLRISEGDATINDGVGGCVNDVADLIETVSHELGHVIGLGHSSENPAEPNRLLRDALMYAFAHHDGRGAALNADDIAGVSTLYPSSDEPDTDEDGVPDRRDRCPETPAGFVADVEGCSCTEPGGRGCDDDDRCTVDLCDDATGACRNEALDCRDEDPCTVDRCDRRTAGCVNQAKGDSDGDGLCDPIDNCPLQPDADPTDLNADGVGDGCQCADPLPGRCIPGRGPASRRCLVEWLPQAPAPVTRALLPSTRLVCTDGDPSCDEDGVPYQCTVRVAVCVNNEDPRFPTCRPFPLRRLAVKSPRLSRARDGADAINAASLSNALHLLTGIIDLGSQGLNLCSDHLPIVVPTGRNRPGSKQLTVRVSTFTGRRGKARLTVTCLPAGP
jgi:hypothetical protein